MGITNIESLIGLIATILFIPIVIILLLNRPWQRQHRLLLLYLIPAMLWSLCYFLGHSQFPGLDPMLMVKLVGCLAIWMGIQAHYLLLSFYRKEAVKIPFAYLLLVGAIALAVLGYMPQSAPDINTVLWGGWFILIASLLIALVSRDIYLLMRKYRISTDVVGRNQILYLVAGLMIAIILIVSSFIPASSGFPTPHIANLNMAAILIYTIVAHRLLDIRVALRRTLAWLSLAIIAAAAYSAVFWLAYFALGFEINPTMLGVSITIAILTTALIYWLLGIVSRKVGEIFTGERYAYRQKLTRFTYGTANITSLEVFNTRLVTLLCQSINSQRAWLLLPWVEGGDFMTEFSYFPDKVNPPPPLKLRQDSPLLGWLKQKACRLSQRELGILPESSALWQKEKEDIQSAKIEMFFPVMNEGRLVAVLALGKKQKGELYTVEDISLVEFTINRVAAAIEKEYLHEQLVRREEELGILNRLMAIITSSINIKEIFEGFLGELKRVAEIDWATITLADGNELYFLALSSVAPSPWQAEERIPLSGTGTEWVMREQRSLYEPDLLEQRRFWRGEKYLKQGFRSIVYLPLITGGKSIGALIISSRHPQAYDPRQIQLMEQLALQIAAPIENSQLYVQARDRARIDELTGLFNRRHFDERLKEEITRHARYGGTFSLLMLDLDDFKTYNDMWGHPAGDRLLNQVSRLIGNAIRTADQAFRYGGDEFTIIMPQTDINSAYNVAERVRQQIALQTQEELIGVTCSIGLANYPTDGMIPINLVTVADTALYHAKHSGGNQCFRPQKILPRQPAAAAVEMARGGSLTAIYSLTAAVDVKDHYSYTHSHKVRGYAVALAEAIGLPPDAISRIGAASLLHDIGKIVIPDCILTKKEELTAEEWEEMKDHPRLGASIISNVPSLVSCVPIVMYHHEHYDGSGYPKGLKGEAIPLEARVLGIADASAAMTSIRPYQPRLSYEEAIEELRRQAGRQFDPQLVPVFIDAVVSTVELPL